MLYLLSSTVITSPGLTYDSEIISVEAARSRVHEYPWTSAIGHASTAAIASTLLGVEVPVSRDEIFMADGDTAICIKLRRRAPEGVVLSRDEVEAIGFDLVLLSAHDPARRQAWAKKMEQVAALLCLPDAPPEGEQPCGTRRRGKWSMKAHFVIRLPETDGGGFVSVTQEWGSDKWAITDVSAKDAAKLTSLRG